MVNAALRYGHSGGQTKKNTLALLPDKAFTVVTESFETRLMSVLDSSEK